MNNLYRLFLIVTTLIPILIFGQDTRVLVRNSPDNTPTQTSVQIKWYSQEFPFYEQGSHVYRRESGTLNWEKLTTKPISRINNFDTIQYYKQEPDIGFYTEVVKEITREQLEEAGFIFVNILVKSFESRIFAEFLGNYYEDLTAMPGVSYEYRVNKLVNGRESLLGQSKSIIAGLYQPQSPVDGFAVEQVDSTFAIDWKIDSELFYGTNIYQYSDSLGEIRLNANPLLVSERTDTAGNIGYPSPKFVVRDLKEGETYTYSIAGIDFFGSETKRTKKITLKLKDTTPPLPPTDFQGKADSMKVHLNWNISPSDDLQEVRLYRSMLSDGPFEPVYSSTLSTSHTDSITVPGPYYYYLASVDSSGNEATSRKIFIEVQDVFPPEQPKNLTIRVDTGRIFLKWDPNKDPDLKGYLVYRTVNKDSRKNYVLLNSKPLLETEMEQPLPKQTKNEFFYFVVALDTTHNRSMPSAYVSATMPDITAPERPHIKTVVHYEMNSVIEWVLNVDNDLVGYHILRADSLAGSFNRINPNLIHPKINRFTDRSTEANTTYYYQVVAVDSANNMSEPSLPYSFYKGSKVSSFDTETLVLKSQFHKRSNMLSLRWKLSEGTSSSLLGYVVYAGSNDTSLKPITGLIKETSIKTKIATNSTDHYQVRAYTATGQTLKSEVLSMENK